MTMRRSSTGIRLARALALGAVVAFAGTTLLASAAVAATTADSLDETLRPVDLAQKLAGPGVTVSNVTYTGSDRAAGLFTETDPAVFGFEDGVVLSTGDVGDIVGPNDATNTTTVLGTPGDEQLTDLAGYDTFDAAVLAFDFVPQADTIYISYVFASEEYSEYANQTFNDVFAFFVNDENCAVTDTGAPVSVNTINGGNPDDGSAAVRPDLFRDNTEGTFDMEPDGLTVVLVCEVGVQPNAVNTMRLAIADGSDPQWDSWVLLAAKGITTVPPVVALPATLAVTDAAVDVGDEVVVTASVDNPNDVEQQVAQLSVELPDGVQYVVGSASGVGEPQMSGSTLDFADAGTIGPGESLTFTFALMPSAAGTVTIGISGETASGTTIAAGAIEVTARAGIVEPPPADFPWGVVLAAGAAIVLVLAGATVATVNTPRVRQTRLLRKHVRLTPRQDTVGRFASTPASKGPETPKAPAFRLVARQGTVEHRVTPKEEP